VMALAQGEGRKTNEDVTGRPEKGFKLGGGGGSLAVKS
jgi:hypothetical protein